MQHKSSLQFLVRRTIVVGVSLSFFGSTSVFAATTYAPWLTQIGLTDAIASAANWGKSQVLGVVDTGIVTNYSAFATGQISTSLSSCAAVSFRCANGVNDDNSHGTAVAEIAAGNKASLFNTNYGGYVLSVGNVISVAPNANIVSEKVLNAQGSGYSTDVANGVRKAADAGASVINVSITYGNSADIVSAINYAASKGAFIVWAGGNSSVALLSGANTTGLTAAAISHLVFAGSVNSKNVLSTFSNTPGAGNLVDTSNAKTSYASHWVMTPGENIVAPAVTSGPNAWAYWSGTSMSAPIVSGSLLLLEAAWPILKTNGTAVNLLLSTTTDLGAKGIDNSYGTGLVNLGTAFKPYGTLAVTQSNGKTIAVSSLTGALISGGALGSLATVQSKLASYTAFDGFARNFTVNLSGLIKTPTSAATLNPLPTNTRTAPAVLKLADGAEFSYWQAPEVEHLGFYGDPVSAQDNRIGYAMYTDKAGTAVAFGYGAPVQNAFARALYGSDEMAQLSGELGVANLSSLAQGGGLIAYGMKLNDTNRMAFSWSGTEAPVANDVTQYNTFGHVNASSFNVGLTHQFSDNITATTTFGTLNEQHGLLGSNYDSLSALSLGSSNDTYSVGFSAGFVLGQYSNLLLETGFAMTKGGSASGMFTGTSDIRSNSYGATYMTRNLINKADRLSVSLMQPLRVSSGRVGLLTQTVDELGLAHGSTEWVSLAPNGREIDFKLAYDTPLSESQNLSLQAKYQKDANNIQGENSSTVGAAWTMRF